MSCNVLSSTGMESPSNRFASHRAVRSAVSTFAERASRVSSLVTSGGAGRSESDVACSRRSRKAFSSFEITRRSASTQWPISTGSSSTVKTSADGLSTSNCCLVARISTEAEDSSSSKISCSSGK